MILSEVYSLFLEGITFGIFLGAIVFSIFSFIHFVFSLLKNV